MSRPTPSACAGAFYAGYMSGDVARRSKERRYEVYADDELAGVLEYRDDGDAVALTHTEVFEDFSGRGLGAELVAGALDDLRERGRSVIAECPYVLAYIERHPGYADLLGTGSGDA